MGRAQQIVRPGVDVLNARANAVIHRLATIVEPKALSSPRWRRPILIIAAAGFALGILLSLRAQPDAFDNVAWLPLCLLAFAAVPATIALNALEFQLSARLIGHEIGFGSAVKTTIIGGVANMLPLPGGTIVRVAALKAAGATLGSGTSVTLFVALMWFGAAFAYSGLWLAILDQPALGYALLIVGVLILLACVLITRRLAGGSLVTYQLIAAKIGLVLIDAIRIHLCFEALDVASTFGQASVLTVASILGASVSIVPAGLGVREGASALIGPLVGLAAASAYLSSSLNRIVGLAVSGPVALALIAWKRPGR